MSCFDIQILNPDINTLEVSTCVGDNDSASVNITTSDNISTLEVSTCIPILSEIISNIPVKDILAGSGIGVINTAGIYTISLSDTNLTTSDISDFLEGVQDIIGNSGLYAGNYINLNYNDTTGLTTVSVTGVQPSGNYSLVGHSHTTSDISNFSTGVSGLLPLLSGSGYVNTSFKNNIYTISVSGLQPSGNYSLVGHSHQASDITNFNSAVSGLIPPSNFTSLTGISGIIVTNSGTDYIVKLDDPTIQLIDITDLSSNARTFLLTPSSSNLSTLVSDETGSGSLVFNNSPNFSGIPTVPTATSGTNTNQIASTAFVRSEINNLIDYAPTTLDTLNELAAALGDDANFASTVTNSLASKAAISGVIFTGSVTIPSGTGNFNNLTVNEISVSLSGHSHNTNDISDFSSGVSGLLPSVTGINYITSTFTGNTYSIGVTGLQPSGNYSVVGHSHVSNDITNFDNSVSGLLPVVIGTGYVLSSFDNNIYSISVSGLQPSGNYSVVGHNHIIADVSGLQDALDSKQPSGVYASGIHYHISSDISDFNTSVSGLLPSVTGTGYINSSFNNNIYSISVSGLQPSGNYSLDGHTHTSSNITDFNSSVSGLLPVKNISGSGYIQVSSSSGDFIVSATGLQPSGNYSVVGHTHVVSDITNFNSGVSGLLPSITGTGYVISTFDNNIYSISVSGLQSSGNYANAIHSHTSSDITDFNSSVSGLLPVKNIVAGTSVSVSSVSGEFTVSVTGVAASSASSIITSCHNLTGSTISKMSAVYINGGHGNEPTIALAIANAESTSSKTFGVTMEDILFNQSGDVVVVGSLIDVNTNQFSATEGTTLYLSPSVSGGLTITKPLAPDHLVTIGKIVRNHNNQGVIEISIQNGFELGELHNVSTNGSGDNGKFLQYNSGSGLWLASSSGNFTSLNVNGTGVSINGHSHTSSSITDFNSSVSGLLPSVTGTGYVNSSFNNNIYTISVNGLQPSGNYSTVGHTHTSSNITDFNSSVSGLLPSVTGSTYITTSFSNNTYTINATGLQPSGNYSLSGHTHTSSNITDFNSSVSGLLPNIANSGDNRILTSIGTTTGINAESNLTFDGSTLNVDGNLVFDSFTESVVTIGNSSTSKILSLTNGTVQTCTLTGNCVFTMPSLAAGKSFTLFLNSGAGGFTGTFTGVLWAGGTTPTITTTASKVDILSFISDGSYWYGSYSQNY